MKSYPIIFAFILFNNNLFASPFQTQPGQAKVEEQGSLKLGEPQKRTLAPDAIHVWKLTLEFRQYAVVEVEPKNINVAVRVVDPQGVRKGEFDSPTLTSGREKAAWIAPTRGEWKVEVFPQGTFQSGEYEIEFMILRYATQSDWQTLVADSLNHIARIYYAQGKYAEAESLHKRTLAIREKVLGTNHSDVAQSLNSLGILYYVQGKYAEAEALYKRSLTILEGVLGPNHPNVAESFNNLAALYQAHGKYNEAELFYKRSLVILEKVRGIDHLDIATNLNNLAVLYKNQGRYSQSEPLYRRSVTILEKVLGVEHPTLAQGLFNLGRLYEVQGKYADAESLFMRSLMIREKILTPDHTDLASSLHTLAVFYKHQGKQAQAKHLLQRALAIREKALGPNHPFVANTLNNLAGIYQDEHKYVDAKHFYERSLAIRQKALGLNHPDIASTLSNLAGLYAEVGKYPEADSLYRKSLEILEKAFGPNHPNAVISLNNLALSYAKQGKYTEAESLFERILPIQEKTLGKEHPQTANTLNNLAHLYYVIGAEKLEIALLLIEQAIQILNATTGYPKWRVDAYAFRALLRHKKGNWEGALVDLDETLHSVEKLRPQIGGSEEVQAFFFEQYSDYFNRMVAWQIEAGQIEKAIEYAERGRARVLLDQLATSQVDLRSSIPSDIHVPLEKRETDAKARLAEYQQRITRMRSRKDLSEEEKQNQITALQDSLRLADRDYQQVYEEIKNASPLWRNVITSSGQPIALTTIQGELIPKNGLMLLYQIGKEESHLFIIPSNGQQPEALPLQVTDKTASILGLKTGPLKSTDL